MPLSVAALRKALRHLTTPLIIDDYTSQFDDLWSARELRGRIARICYPTADTVTLTIITGWEVPTDFRPGQHIGLGVQIDGRWRWRSYSLTDNPQLSSGRFTVTVREVIGGAVSHHLQAHARVGMSVRLAAPSGDFYLPTPPPAKLGFITAGSGLTPIISMLRSLDPAPTSGPTPAATTIVPQITHIHIERSAENVAYLDELTARATAPNYQLQMMYTSERPRPKADELLDLVGVDADADADEQPQIYACGPPALLTDLEKECDARGAEKVLHRESFSMDRSAAGEGGTIHFGTTHSDAVVVESDGATSILEAAESVGVNLPYGCRMGVCSTCTVPLLDGNAADLRTGEVYEPGQRIRACSCAAAGNCRIEYNPAAAAPPQRTSPAFSPH